MLRFVGIWVALTFSVLSLACSDDSSEDGPAGASGLAGRGGASGKGGAQTAGASGQGGNAGEAGRGGSAGEAGRGGSGGQSGNAGAAGRGGDAGQSGNAGAAGQGGDAGRGGSGGGGAPSCGPLEAIISGSVGATAIRESYEGSGYFFPYDSDDVSLRIGGEGRAHLRPAEPLSEGQAARAAGVLQLPATEARDRTFVCAGEGSSMTLYKSGPLRFTAHLSSLSKLGTCPGGAPVAGEVNVFINPDGSGPSMFSSSLEGARFNVFAGDSVLKGDLDTLHFNAELATESPAGLAFFSFAEAATAPLDEGGYIVVPDGAPDAGAIYCAGAGSTVATEGSGPALRIRSVSLKNLTRLGACPSAPASGELDLCGGALGGPGAR